MYIFTFGPKIWKTGMCGKLGCVENWDVWKTGITLGKLYFSMLIFI
jgi:hypothetical protein